MKYNPHLSLLTIIGTRALTVLRKVFDAAAEKLISFNIRTAFNLKTRILFFFFVVFSFFFFLLEIVYAQVMFVFVCIRGANGIKTLPHLILR